MATYTWTGAANDQNWNDPANWSGGVTGGVPGAGDTAILPAGLTGPIDANSQTITWGGPIQNNETIAINAGANYTDLIINGAVTLSGTGVLAISDSSPNRVYSNQGGSVLTNQETIEGAGTIYSNGNLSIVNGPSGVIDASAKNNALNLSSIGVTNDGLIEATGAAGLNASGDVIDQTGGGVLEANGGPIALDNVSILGGLIEDGPGGGLIHATTGVRLDGTVKALTIAKGTVFQIDNNASATLTSNGAVGSIVNDGEILLDAGPNYTDLIVGAGAAGGTVALSGGGTVQLSDSSPNRIYSNTGSTTLDNIDNTIEGAGTIYSNGNLSLVNEAKGVIDAYAAGNALNLQSIAVVNKGLIESTGAGGLSLSGVTLNEGTSGALEANGGAITLNSTTIIGGPIEDGAKGGLIHSTGGVLLDGTANAVTITKGTLLQIDNNANVTLNSNGAVGSIVNDGEILLDAGPNYTDLIVGAGAGGGTVALSGGGTVQLSDNSPNRIYSNTTSTTLDNVDNTIQGAGTIFSNGNMSLVNEAKGVIDASSAVNALTLQDIGVVNKGLIESTAAGGLTLSGATITQGALGVLAANGGDVTIGAGVDIVGGTLTSLGGAFYSTSGSSLLDGTGAAAVTIAAGTTLHIVNGANISLASNGATGAIVNHGAISLESTVNYTDIIVGSGKANGTVVLSGGGTVQFSDKNTNRIYSNSPSTTLDNMDNTIQGAGEIYSNGNLSFVNEAAGVIDGTSATSGHDLRIDGIGVLNKGLIEGTGAGGLELDNMTLTNAGAGMLEANGGAVTLGSNSHIVGGAIASVNAGALHVNGGGTQLDGTSAPLTIDAGTVIQVDNSNNLTLSTNGGTGAIVNKGEIFIDAGNNYTDLLIGSGASGGTLKLSGGGLIQFSDSNDNRLYSNTPLTTLDNMDNTIQGAGEISANGNLSLVNEAAGVIDGTSATSGNSLRIDNIGIVNKGLIESTGAGGLEIDSMTLTGVGAGVLEANGGVVTIGNSAHLIGGALASVNGGLLQVSGGSSQLDGTTAAVTIDAGTVLQINNGSNLALSSNGMTGSIVNKGEIFVDAGPNYTDLLVGSGAGGGTVALSGGGTIQFSDSNDNRIYSNTPLTTLDNIDNTFQGAGDISANGNLSLVNEAAGVIDGTSATSGNSLRIDNIGVVNKGLIEGTGAGGLEIDNMTLTGVGAGVLEANGGVVTIGNSTHLIGGALASVNGGLLQVSGGSSQLDGTTAAVTIDSGTVLQIDNASNFTLSSNGVTASLFNKGEIFLDGGQNYTDLIVGSGAGGGTVALSGGGVLQLSDAGTNRIYSNTGSTTLDNIDNTVEGAGTLFGNGNLSVVNEAGGVFDATFADQALNIQDMSFDNLGVLRAQNGATLALNNALQNIAADPNHSGGAALTGGTYDVIDPVGGGGASVIAISGGAAAPITTLAADVNLAGASSDLTSAGVSLHSSLLEIAGGGALNLFYGFNSASQQVFADAHTLTVDSGGYISLAGAALTGGALDILSGGVLHANGVFDAGLQAALVGDTIDNAGQITVDGVQPGAVAPQTVFSGAIVNTGDIAINQDASAEFAGGVAGGVVTFGDNQSLSGTGVAGEETLKIDAATVNPGSTAAGAFTAAVAGFGLGDVIDLSAFGHETSYSFDGAHLVVNFATGGQATLALTGVGLDTGFQFAADGSGGTLITTGFGAQLANDTGVSATDAITSNANLTGTGDVGQTVTLSEGGKTLGTTVVGADGVWSFSPTGLADGVQTILASESNGAGDSASAAVTFTLATQAPGATIVQSATGLTASKTLTVSGVATPEAVGANAVVSAVLVDASNTTVAVASLGSGGAYSASLSGLSDGAHDYTLVVTDTAGDVSRTALAEVDVATQKPSLNASQTLSGVTTQTTDVVSGTASAESVPGDAIASVAVFDGSTQVGAATSGTFSVTLNNLATGAHNISVVATDKAGNATTQTLAPFTVQASSSAPPSVTASLSNPGLTNSPSETLTATATANPGQSIVGVEVFDKSADLGAASFSSATGQWSFTASGLADGEHDFSLTTTDSAHLTTTTPLAAVFVATHMPSNGTPSESVSGVTNQTSETISLTPSVESVGANAVKSVVVTDTLTGTSVAATAGTGGVYSASFTGLGDGAHVYKVTTTDLAGNNVTTTLPEVDVDTHTPSNGTPSESVTGVTNQTSETISLTPTVESVGANAVKSVVVTDTLTGTSVTATAGTGGVYSASFAGLGDGAHIYKVTTTDLAGNGVTTTLPEVDVVTHAPSNGTPSESVTGVTNQTSETISLTPSVESVGANAVKSVVVTDTLTGTSVAATAGTGGVYSASFTGLGDGAHAYKVTTTDLAGNNVTTTLPEVDVVTHTPSNGTPSESVSGVTNQTSETISLTPSVESVGANAVKLVVVTDTLTGTSVAATAGTGGVYSASFTGLGDGAHVYKVTTTDLAGNSGSTTLPEVDVVTHMPSNGTPSESVTGVTNQTSETISLTPTVESVGANAVKSVVVTDTLTGTAVTATAGTGGVYSASFTGLGDGAHVYKVTTTDLAGNGVTTMLPEVDVATKAPMVSATQSVSGQTDTLTITATPDNVPNDDIVSVAVSEGASALGSATLSNGIWTFAAKNLTVGAHTLSLLTTDSAGNTTTTTLSPISITLPPPVVTAGETLSGLTNQTADTIFETATAASGLSVASVEVLDGKTDVGAATYSAKTGQWSLAVSKIPDGVHDYSTVTTDSAGGVTTTTLPELDVATVKPVVTAKETPSGLTNVAKIAVSGTAVAEAVGANAIVGVDVYDGTTRLGAATLTNGQFSFTTATLADGVHNLSLKTTDSAGNVATTALAPVDVATRAPTVSVKQSLSGLTNKNIDVITETASAEAVGGDAIASVQVLDGGKALGAATLTNGVWSFTTPTLADGVHTLSTLTTDAAGNATTSVLAPISIATKAPALTVSQNVSGLTDLKTVTVSGAVSAEATPGDSLKSVQVFDGTKLLGAATVSGGKYSFTTPTLADGVHNLSVVATDAAGNVTTDALAPVAVATQAPTVKASQSLSGVTNKNLDTITATATAEAVGGDAIASVKVLDGATSLGFATFTSGVWSFTTPTLADGAHTLSLLTTDTAGNVATTALAPVAIATTAPVVKATQSVSGLTQQRTETLSETATAEAVGANAIASVQVYDLYNGVDKLLGDAKLANGVWSYTTGQLAYGVHVFSTVTTDTAGNATTATLLPDNVEPPPPPVTIKLVTDSSKGHEITNKDALTGGGDPNATVSFTIDGVTSAQTATANSAGVWTFTPANLSQGAHTIVASETNGGGTGTASLTFTYDSVPPVVAIATPAGAQAYATRVIDGTGEAGTSVQLYDGAAKLGGPVTVGANGLWSETVTLAAGANAITARDTDAANNIGTSAAISLPLDNQIAGVVNQLDTLGTNGADHITVAPGDILVQTLGGDDTVSLTSAGGPSQYHVLLGGGGVNTLDLSQTSGAAWVDLAAQLAMGPQIGTNYVFNFANIVGGGGAETLIGGPGAGAITAGSGDDILTGGGGADTFNFNGPFGQDTITDFVAAGASHGVVTFDESLFPNWAAIDSALNDTAAGASITLGAHETLTFAGVTKATLEANHAADFKIT